MISVRWKAALRHGGASLAAVIAASPGHASPCAFAALGEAVVAQVIDGRSLRLDDGREIVLAGIETAAEDRDAAALVRTLGRRVQLSAEPDGDAPDRYGRQRVWLTDENGASIQRALVADGAAAASPDSPDACRADLFAAEAAARAARRGLWRHDSAIKRAANPDDIRARVGRFTLVEGRITAVREAGATTYLNFGRRWTQGFAVTISRRDAAALEAAGIALKTLQNRRVRVRGFIADGRAPRMALRSRGQIEVLGD